MGDLPMKYRSMAAAAGLGGDLLTVDEASRACGFSSRVLRRWAAEMRLPVAVSAGVTLVCAADLERMIVRGPLQKSAGEMTASG